MGMDDRPQLENLLNEYVAISDKHTQEKIEKALAEAERIRQEKKGRTHAYEEAKAELAAELEATVNGSYTSTLIRILKDQPSKTMDIGNVTRASQESAHAYDHKYGIRLNNPTEGKGPIIFYAGNPHSCAADVSPLELLDFVTVRGIDDLPKLVLTAPQYKENLTKAVSGALTALKKSEGAQ